MWVNCECHKNPLFEGVGLEPMRVLRVFNKNPVGTELPLWRLSYNFTKTDGGLDLAVEDKGTPHGVALLAP